MHRARSLLAALTPYALRVGRRALSSRYVILHGFYGAGNVGDEALLQSSLHALRDLPPSLTPFVFCREPERVTADYGVPALDPAVTRRKDLAAVWVRSAAYLLGGGGLLKDYGAQEARTMERQWLRWLDQAAQAGVKTMTWSVGVENIRYETSKQALRDVLGRVDRVTVRDEASRDRLRAVGVTRDIEVTADPVPALVHHRARKRAWPEQPRVAVCARHWYPYEFKIPDETVYQQLLDALAAAADHAIERYDATVEFVPFRTSPRDDDRAVHREIIARMRHQSPSVVVHEQEDPEVDWAICRLDQADLVLGVRLHASVIATAMAIPSIAVAYMPKVNDFMAQIGQQERCVEIEDATADRLRDLVDRTIADYEGVSGQLLENSHDVATAFSRNMSLLNGLLA